MYSMADFIAEIRPRSHHISHHTTQYITEGFVSEIRPRHHESTQPKSVEHGDSTMDFSDRDLQNILSGKFLSKENIRHILQGSVLTLVEKLLTGRSIAQIDGQIRVSLFGDESPLVVDLHKDYPKSTSSNYDYLAQLGGKLNVKVKDRDSPISLAYHRHMSYHEGSPPHDYLRDDCPSLDSSPTKGSCSPPGFSVGYQSDAEASLSSPPHQASLGSPIPTSPPEQSLQETHGRRDSDEESGYTSNEKEDCDIATEHVEDASDVDDVQPVQKQFNAYFCSGFDGKNTLYEPEMCQSRGPTCENTDFDCSGSSAEGSDEMDDEEDDDTEFESPLVIDEAPDAAREGQSVEPMETPEEPSADSRGQAALLPCDGHLTEETDDTDSPLSSDSTDTDAQVDLSGDSLMSSGVLSGVPHPQSLVTKHQEGFKCKHCPQVLSDPHAVASHAQKSHNLFCCTYCYRTFTAKNNLKRHVRLHTGLRPYKCSQCSQSFARRDDLKGHMLRHDFSKPFRCSVCKKGYTDRACVKNHMAKEHRSRLMHVCPQCGESFDHDDAFTAHKKSHPELEQFACKTCSFIGTNNLMTQKHGLLHSRKLFSCKPCNAYFADPFDYTNHVRKHKKNSDFCSYICCFCDVSLATYDQFVRHEYSHAQGKTHACKVCKKQFKSKALLSEHASTHQSTATDVAENISVQEEDRDKPVDNEVNTSPIFDSCGPWALSSDIPFSKSSLRWASRADYEEYSGQLLDLSMKKPSSPDYSVSDDHRVAGTEQPMADSCSSCPGPFGLTGKCVPRNGCVSESCGLRQGLELADRVHSSRQSVEMQDEVEMTTRPMVNLRKDSLPVALDSAWSGGHGNPAVTSILARQIEERRLLQPAPVYPNRPRSAERNTLSSVVTQGERRPLERSLSGVHTSSTPLRFSPYTREKMADLAAKFVAARGPKLVGQKLPIKTLIPMDGAKDALGPRASDVSQSRHPTLLSELQAQENLMHARAGKERPAIVALREKHDNASVIGCEVQGMFRKGEMSRENSNPETALRCHVPTFVKSEPVLEDEMAAEMLPSPGFRSNKTGVGNGKSHHCELCKEEFGSFPELEAHSVEMHKRYLCEHCGKNFTARPNRDRHVRYHTGVRPYKCDLCDMAFFRGDDLKYHRTTRHPTAQPFVCPRCSASFTWGRDLERHIRHSKCKA